MNSPKDIDGLHPKTAEFIERKSAEERKEMGQYFTPQPIIEEILSNLPDDVLESSDLDILDPSSGTGEFLRYADGVFKDANLEGWELDEELVEVSREILGDSAVIRNVNSLHHEPDRKYDLIIGNPPYYEIKLDDEIRERYGRVIYGRTNIYNLFIYKSLELLRDGGHLAFVNPPSMNNGAYFKELRDYIIENCSIEYMSVHEDSEIFEDASQSVMYIVIKKGGDHNDYVFERNGIQIFSEEAEYLEEEFDGKKTLSDMGFEVRTGRLVWNQNKEKLTEEETENSHPIIWSKNIEDGGVNINPDQHSKPQYIENYECSTGPAVVVNRVVGQPGQGSIRAGLIPDGKKFVAENHVNIIQPKKDSEQSTLPNQSSTDISLGKVLEQLNSDENLDIVQTITGNSQISKTELQELFPFED